MPCRTLQPSSLLASLALLLICAGPITVFARDEPSVTLRTAKAVREAFEKTGPLNKDTGTLAVPAIVSEKLFARFFSISKTQFPQGNDAEWVKQHFALGRQGIGRYFVFVADHGLIEKALIAGQFNPDQIMADVGFGPGATCSSSQNYWLVVFKPRTPPVSAVYFHNLQAWFDHVYGKKRAPKVDPAIETDLISNRFEGLTGCPVDPVTGAFRWSDLKACLPPFAQTVTALDQRQCANEEALTYAPSNRCPTDEVLKSLGPSPSALELRAWLFAANNFSEYFTGNGYAGNFYNAPANREFWVDNAWLRTLPELELLKVTCPAQASRQGAVDRTTTKSAAPSHFSGPPFVETY